MIIYFHFQKKLSKVKDEGQNRHRVYLLCHALGWLQQQQRLIFSQFWRVAACDQGTSRVILWRECSSWLRAAVFSLCPHMTEREKALSPTSYITSVLLDEDPTPMTSFNLSYLPKALSSQIVTLGCRVPAYERGGEKGHSLVHNTFLILSTFLLVYLLQTKPTAGLGRDYKPFFC